MPNSRLEVDAAHLLETEIICILLFDLVPCQVSCQSPDTTEVCAWSHSFPVWQDTLAGILSLDVLKSH